MKEGNIEYNFNSDDHEETLDEFNRLHKILIDDLEKNKIMELDLDERLEKLYDTIPFGYLINTVYLERKIIEKFPDYFDKRWKKRFTVEVEKMNEEEIETHIKEVVKKFKKI